MAAAASLVVKLSAQIADFQKSFNDALGSTSKFERQYAGVASSVTEQQQRINKAFASFAGDAVIRDANALVKAIERVGGASKLTAAEQARVNASVTEAIAKYQALGAEAPKDLHALANATKEIPQIPDPTIAFKKGLADLKGTLNNAAAGLRTAGVGLTAGVTVPLVAAGAAIFKLGVDAVESESLVSVAFGDMRSSADKWSKDLSDKLGLNQFEMRKMSGVLFTMTTGMGLTRDASFEMSTGLSKLAADMASFRNISIDEAFNKLRAGITGETEPLKALGILVDEATVKTYAYSTGIAKQGAELTAQQKVLARYQAILAQTKNDQGDLARTIESPANQLRIMRTRIEEAATSLGVALLPLIQRGIGVLTAFVPIIQDVVKAFVALPQPVQFVAVGVLALVAAVGPLLLVLGTLASSLATLLPLFASAAPAITATGLASATAATGVLTLGSALSALALTGGVVVALAGIAAGIYEVVKAYQALKRSELTTFEFLTQKQDDTWARRMLGLTDQVAVGFGKVHAAAKDVNLALETTGPAAAKSLTPFTDAIAAARKELNDLKKSSPAKYSDLVKGAQSGAFDLTSLKAQSGLSEDALKLLQKDLQATKKEMTEAASAAKELEKAQRDMTEGAIPLSEAQKAVALANERLTVSHAATAKILGVNVNAIDTYINGVKNAAAVDEMWVKTQAELTEGTQKVAAGLLKSWREEADASAANLAKQVTDREKYQRRVSELGMSGVQLTLKHIDDERTAELQSLGQRTAQNARFWDQNRQLIDAYYEHQRRLAVGTPDTLEERMRSLGVQTKATLREMADAAERDYRQMKDSGLYTYKQLEDAAARSGAAQKAAAGNVKNVWLTSFASLGRELPSIFSQGFERGGIAGVVAAGASAAASRFEEVFKAGMERTGDSFKDLKFTEKLAGVGAAAAQSFASGFATGLQGGNSTGGFLSSALGGFLSGFALGGPVGGFAGLGAGLAGYLTGVSDNAEKELTQVRQSQQGLLNQFHGLDNLRKQLDRANFSLTRSGRSQDPLTASTAETFNGRIAVMNAALDAYNERLKAAATATDALNRRTANFGKQFEPLVAAKKTATEKGDTGATAVAAQQIQELAQRTQPEFERLGVFVRGTFAAIVRETGDAFAAITALAPSFQVLKSGISDFGLTSTSVIDSLVKQFDFIGNEAFKPFFENIQSSGKLLKSLFDANILSPETFQAAAADIGQSIQEIVNRGGDMAQALALSAPQLQALWEAQQRFGAVTDQTTKSILDQAVQQGIVGEQFRDVNERILDVLVAIGDVLGAAIPDALRAIPRAAQAAGDGIATSLGGALDGVSGKVSGVGAQISDGLSARAAAAGKEIQSNLGGAFDDVSGRVRATGGEISDGLAARARAAGREIQTSIGGSLDGLVTRSKATADGITANLAKIMAPDLTVDVDVDLSGLKPLNDALSDPRFQSFGAEIPALGRGGIVRRPTLALVGESGPEAVIPLSRLSPPRPSGSDTPAVVFGPGAIVLQGIDGPSIKKLVASGEFAESLKSEIEKNPRGIGSSVKRVTA